MDTKKIKRLYFLLLAAVIFAPNLGCSKPVVGGPCTYSDFVGTATITDLTPHEDGYRIVFDTKFSGDPATPASYNNKGRQVLIKNPSGKTDATWLAAQGVNVNATLDVKVALITSGTCSPVIFKFPSLPADSIRD